MTDYREAAWALLIADGSSLEDVAQALAKRSDDELAGECLRAWSDADELDRELLIRAFGELRDEVEGELMFDEALWG
jgi:hypothetical protein